MTELKSTLKVYRQQDLEVKEGRHASGHASKLLVGNEERPSERISVSLATFEPGKYVPLHWHLIEQVNYVVSGRATLTDIEGKSYDVGPGSYLYISPGIGSAHSWQVIERLEVIAVRGTTSREKNIQFEVDKSTMKSSIDAGYLVKQGGALLKSFY
jgi:quercetin dioxygenase-like cupin family protein